MCFLSLLYYSQFTYTINCGTISWKLLVKSLGIYINSKLTCSDHCKQNYVCVLCTCKGCGIQEYCQAMHGVCLCNVESHTARDCALLDVVQNHAARWTKSSKDCVSDLNWPSLSTGKIFLTCLFLSNVIHGQVISKLKDHLLPQSDISRSHKLSFRTISSTINSYHHSLLNKIPSHLGNYISKFKQALHR